MIYENVELHNIAETYQTPDGGVGMLRVPQSVREHLNEGAQYRITDPAGAEIRFVGDGPVKVTLSCPEGRSVAVVFFGGFQHGEPFIIASQKRTIEITPPGGMFSRLPADFSRDMPFSPGVCRLMLGGSAVCLHGVEGDGIRPPAPDELPDLRYLTYGTSITHGSAATTPYLCYAAQTARHLDADLINLGVGGSAHCEHEFADYIAARDDWDIASLALSVNMMGFTNDQFHERVSYMVNTIAAADTARPVACITLYSFFGDIGGDFHQEDWPGTPQQKRQLLRDAVAACPHPNVHLVEGREILKDMTGLTPDLVHPADNGMIEMGRNLAARLKAIIPARKPARDGRPPRR